MKENDRTIRTSRMPERDADHEFSEKRGQQMVVSVKMPERPKSPPPPPPPASGQQPADQPESKPR
jgi:hypothetical protein